MKKGIIILSLIAAFGMGFTLNEMIRKSPEDKPLKKVTGIGGIFFKCKNPKILKEWYKANLGLNTDKYGTVFQWYHGADSTKKGYTQWSAFSEKTKYFGKDEQQYMINYRVENLPALIEQFKKDGVTLVDTMQVYDYGKFVHILDVEGNRVELWEPNDEAYGKIDGSLTK